MVLAAVELGLRVALGPPPPAVRVHAALGEHDRYFKVNDGLVKAIYGDQGRETFPLKSDSPRFAVLGGSTVHGGTHGIDFPQEFPHRAGRMLGVRAINLGSPGLDSHDLVRIMAELSQLDTSAWVVYTGHNDFGNAHFEGRYGTVSSALVARTQSLLGRLQLYTQVSRAVQPMTGASRRRRNGMEPAANEVRPLTPARFQMALDGLRSNLDRLAWMSEQQGVPMVLVVPVGRITQPAGRNPCDRPGCPAELIQQAQELAPTDPDEALRLLQKARDTDPIGLRAPTAAQDAVRDVAHAHDHITLVDTFADLPRDPHFPTPDRQLFMDPVHLSRRGHTQVAALVALALEPILGVTATLPADAQRLRQPAKSSAQ